jgi:hypothetical protein
VFFRRDTSLAIIIIILKILVRSYNN